MARGEIKAISTAALTGTTTEAINLEGKVLVGIHMPSGISSTTLKLATAPHSGGTFVNIQDGLGQYVAAGDVSFTIAASKYLSIPPALTAGAADVKLVLGSSETSKTFILMVREI